MLKDIEQYCANHSSEESDILKDLTRKTFVNILNPRMLSGHLQGLFLKMIVQMIDPLQVLEIGTYTGYSALCMAEGLSEHGTIHTIEIDDEIAFFAKEQAKKSPHFNKITFLIGDALLIIPQLSETFELVFIDGNKRDYVKYYDSVFDKVASGGFIIADNVLWDGHVLDKEKSLKDPQTRGVVTFNEMIKNDSRVEKVFLPLRDGLFMIRKK